MSRHVVGCPTGFAQNPGWKPVISHHRTHGSDPEKGIKKTGVLKIFINNIVVYPIGSMYAIYDDIYHQYTPNVSIYTIHGSYGYCHLGFTCLTLQDHESCLVSNMPFWICPDSAMKELKGWTWGVFTEKTKIKYDPNLSAAHRHMRLRHSISWLICLLRTDCLRLSQNQNLPPYPWLLPTNPCTGGSLQHW